MRLASLSNDWQLVILEHRDETPMENHGAMDVAADDHHKTMFIHQTMVMAYSLESVKRACETYINRQAT